jgi:hypothetical protein
LKEGVCVRVRVRVSVGGGGGGGRGRESTCLYLKGARGDEEEVAGSSQSPMINNGIIKHKT